MAIIGSILGDIAGSPYEFGRPIDLDWIKCKLFTNGCAFTDDTIMTLATKKAILENKPFSEIYREFGQRYPGVGYGAMFMDWIYTPNAKPYNSYGNGSAMRCSYIGEHFNCEKDVINWAIKSAECTHNHPEGIKGAIVTAMCVYMAKQGETKEAIFNYVKKQYPKDEYKYSVEHELNSYRDTYKWSVTCQNSVPVAIRCFLESYDYESFLRNVLSLRCDTDTLGAIGGGIAEEYYKSTGFNDNYLLNLFLDDYLYKIVKK